jgi:hypothetical protein
LLDNAFGVNAMAILVIGGAMPEAAGAVHDQDSAAMLCAADLGKSRRIGKWAKYVPTLAC